ncbi:hypothetical protein GCM10027416_12960 [Okibacterium endophyticum]
MSVETHRNLYRIASVFTAVIAVTFVVVGIVTQTWVIVGVFAVIGMAGLASYPVLAHPRRDDGDRA